MSHRFHFALLALALLMLGACENYDFKVNDRVVYSPDPLFTDFDVPDPALRACLEQAIVDHVVTAAPRLDSLNCSHAGIADLSGLSTFTGLTTLKLSSNDILNLVELEKLTSLQVLLLDDNQVVDPVPLYQLPALRELDLTGNHKLQCPSSNGFLRVENLQLPTHCL